MLKREEIRIRDPYILTVPQENCYYMYGTTDLDDWHGTARRFSCYRTCDLEKFEGPFVVFDGEKENFWATKDYWAAEVHLYGGKYYMFASFASDVRRKGTQIFVASSPLGPFKPFENAITPPEWECLDGTLFVEEKTPYMVFCHEWVQCITGEIYAVELEKDLSALKGEPFLLFKASDNPAADVFDCGEKKGCRVTDGPFLFREEGKVKMIWSTIVSGRYAVLEAEADNIRSEWRHFPARFPFDGGHAMIFTALDGKKYFSLHTPNTPKEERAVFLPYTKE